MQKIISPEHRKPPFGGFLCCRYLELSGLDSHGHLSSICQEEGGLTACSYRHCLYQLAPKGICILTFVTLQFFQTLAKCRLNLLFSEGGCVALFLATVAVIAIPDIVTATALSSATPDLMPIKGSTIGTDEPVSKWAIHACFPWTGSTSAR